MTSILALMAFAKISAQSIWDHSWSTTLVVGHRGAAAYKPENTLPAFEEGIACKADAVECDIHLSQDGQMMVMHDATLDRTTSLKGRVDQTASKTMIDAGVPTLAALTRVTKNRVVLIVEVKEGEGIERKMVEHLKEEKMEDQTIIFSFHDDRIAKVEELDSALKSVWLVGQKLDPMNLEPVFTRLKEIHADGVGVDYRNCPAELATEARKRHIPLFVWTVPPGAEVDRLKALRVNFIISNHPRDIRSQLGL